jgi:Rrf2 family transcriptional regulator, nitric oxide-sensitive transcriptional repressor
LPFRGYLDVRLTSFSDYTLRTLIYLALRPKMLCTIDEISTAYHISNNHLTKVVHQAAKAGELETVRGQGGGMRLAQAASDIVVGSVLRRTEPDLHIAPCFCPGSLCPIQPACLLQEALGEAVAAFLEVLDRVTLVDLIRPKRQLIQLLQLPPTL